MRKTKIIATLGPATDSPEIIGRMIDGGMNIARLNMSHAKHEWVRRIVKDIREAAAARRHAIGILMDTQGPAIRTGDLSSPIELKPGQRFSLMVRGEKGEEGRSTAVNYDNFIDDINVGDTVLLDNGEIQMKVLEKFANQVECEVLTSGTLGSRRHINLPGVKVSLPALTEKDRLDVALALELDLDYLAMSFVREAKDIREMKKLIASASSKPIIVAKIENQQGVENLMEIVRESDALMIARGDLGIEVPYEELPIIQRRAVKFCQQIGRPVIVATHMLESMIENPIPTRAEVTDVANAVFEQTDAIMLSGETTVGKYPLKCLEVFDRVAQRTERSGGANFHLDAELENPRQKLVKSATIMANDLRADAILVFTLSGTSARYAAWMRPRYSPVYAICDTQPVADSLTLCWGVRPVVIPYDHSNRERTISLAIEQLVERKLLERGNTTVVISSINVDGQTVKAVQMREV